MPVRGQVWLKPDRGTAKQRRIGQGHEGGPDPAQAPSGAGRVLDPEYTGVGPSPRRTDVRAATVSAQ
jgi:hypothetical protein